MNDIESRIDVRTDPLTEPRSDYAPTTQECTYTTQQLAAQYEVKPTTISSWVNRWLTQVAPAELLKQGKGLYTELAHTLLNEFAVVDSKERPIWVVDAKKRYSAEWGNAGIIECEIVPDAVGGTLALMQTYNNDLEQEIALQLAQLETFTDEISAAEANFSESELKQFQAAGIKRGLQRFQIETQAEVETVNALRQRRMQGGKA